MLCILILVWSFFCVSGACKRPNCESNACAISSALLGHTRSEQLCLHHLPLSQKDCDQRQERCYDPHREVTPASATP